MEVKTARRLLKIIKFCIKRVVPGLLIAIFATSFIISVIQPEKSQKIFGIAWISMIPLLIALFIFEEAVEGIISKHKRSRFIKEEDNWWREHPRGKSVIITDINTGETIGTIKNEQLRFLIDVFTEEHMEENDFCFINELFDIFVEEKKPDPSLIEFIRNALRDKDEIILHWEKE